MKVTGMSSMIEYYLSKAIKKMHLRAIRNCQIHESSRVCAGCHLVNVSIAKYTDIGYDCTIINTKIGAFCSLGANINIGGANHSVQWVSTSPVFNENRDHISKKFARFKFENSSSTSIGNDVWIGDRVLIKAGVSVGDGVVIGMGSVVTKDIPSYEIWAGNPARKIKSRFGEEIVRRLLAIKWWDLSDREIEIAAQSFNNVDEFVRRSA